MAGELEDKAEKFFHSKWTWIGAGVAALSVVYYFHKNKESAAASATAPPATDTADTTDDSSDGLDNSYGDDSTYSPIDASEGAYGVTPSDYAYDPADGEYDIYTGGTTSTGTAAPTTNSQWAELAETNLTNAGYDSTTSAAALGKYLLGSTGGVTTDQLSIIQAAIALTGYPPTAVPTPQVAPAAPAKAASTAIAGTFIRNVATGTIYQINASTKTKYHVTAATWNKLKTDKEVPKYTDVLPSDPRLKYKNGGNI